MDHNLDLISTPAGLKANEGNLLPAGHRREGLRIARPEDHVALYGLRKAPFRVASRWFEGACDIQTYELDELLGTKLRALYQRKQARDLFDFEIALTRLPVEPQRIVAAFLEYMVRDG